MVNYAVNSTSWLLANGKDYDGASVFLDGWIRLFDSQDEPAKFGNTAAGAFVKEVKLGVNFAGVEAALGLPATKVDLGARFIRPLTGKSASVLRQNVHRFHRDITGGRVFEQERKAREHQFRLIVDTTPP